jgi:hypothetical protein
MAENRIRKLGWLAPLALVVAGGLAACGDEDASDTRTAGNVEASLGSDQHLYNQAAEIAARTAVMGSDVHLYNQAAEIAARTAVMGSDVHLYNQAAEIADTQAQRSDAATGADSAVMGSDVHLYNQAAEIADTSGTDAGPNVWEAGNRAVEAAR